MAIDQSNQPINQSIDQSINQPTNQPTHQSIDQSTNQPINFHPPIRYLRRTSRPCVALLPGNGRHRRGEGPVQERVGTSAEALPHVAGLGDDGVAARQACGGQVNTSDMSDARFTVCTLWGRHTRDSVILILCKIYRRSRLPCQHCLMYCISAWHGSSALLFIFWAVCLQELSFCPSTTEFLFTFFFVFWSFCLLSFLSFIFSPFRLFCFFIFLSFYLFVFLSFRLLSSVLLRVLASTGLLPFFPVAFSSLFLLLLSGVFSRGPLVFIAF